MAKKNEAANNEQKYVVGSICSFSHKGKLYTEGMAITAAIFPSEAYFKLMIKQGKIVPAPVDEAENNEAPAENAGAENGDGAK